MAEEEDNQLRPSTNENVVTANSLCLKFKVPKEFQQQDQEEVLPFVCPVCEKRFKSGKALGGHKRMHNIITKKADIDKDEEEDHVHEDGVVCPECSKTFRSKKSLFGHMRSHPERPWRGIQPPNSTVSLVSDSPPLSWSVTGKRNRKSTTTTTTSSSASVQSSMHPGMDNDVKEVVLHLMLLAHYKPIPDAAAHADYSNQDDSRSDSWHCSDDDGANNKRKRPKMKLVDGLHKEEEEEEEEEEELESSSNKVIPSSINDDQVKKNNKKKNKVASSRGVDDESEMKKKYVCSACDKSFASYQALGGHRSSHNKLISDIPNKTYRFLLNLDLNEPPPPEHESSNASH